MDGTGADASAGVELVPYRPLFWVSCSALGDFVAAGPSYGSDGVTESFFAYTVTLFSNGDVDVACETAIGSAELAADSAYFPRGRVGASFASCITPIDYPPFGLSVGSWRYAILEGTPEAEYADNDSAHPLVGTVVSFGEADCTVLIADENGEWSETTLAEVFD